MDSASCIRTARTQGINVSAVDIAAASVEPILRFHTDSTAHVRAVGAMQVNVSAQEAGRPIDHIRISTAEAS